MLGNQQADLQVRLDELIDAIKRVYASTFSHHAKAYVRATRHLDVEERDVGRGRVRCRRHLIAA